MTSSERARTPRRPYLLRRWPRPATLVVLPLLVLVTACGATIPSDPDGTLERVRGGVLRVGVSPHDPWTVAPAQEGEPPGGTEVGLLDAFARSVDAEVEWHVGAEEQLIGDLERGRLDVVAGGLTVSSPWAQTVALTAVYRAVPGPDGALEGHVVAVPAGENAFQVELERFLIEETRG